MSARNSAETSFTHGVAVVAFASALLPVGALAQRANENAVTEASDAFGITVGREEIGLYSATNARGFNPSLAGNLRIDGLYFDQVNQANLGSRLTRGSSVHVGISAQGFPFPAPTGVVDFHLRTPGDEALGGVLLGIASFDQAYGEIDFQTPLVANTLSIGGGLGYSRNNSYQIADSTDEWNIGGLVRWRPTEDLTIVPFFGKSRHLEYGEKTHVFIGHSGWPRYRSVDLDVQPWAEFGFDSTTAGATARHALGDDWRLDAGLFYSEANAHFNVDPALTDVDGDGRGHYSLTAVPARTGRSTSGEVRLSRKFVTETVSHTLYAAVKGRDRSNESGGGHTVDLGPATTTSVPQISKPVFATGEVTLVEATQYMPGLAYEGVWRNVGQLSLGVQKVYYDRTITPAAGPAVSGRSEPWLYNFGAAAYAGRRVAIYGNFTRGFEEIGAAPLNAANRDEVVPAQLTKQIDGGFKFQWTPTLVLVAGAFEIEKPFFDLDETNVFRQLGTTRNRGIELSLAGELTGQLTIVAGVTAIDPTVTYLTSTGTREQKAIGPIPGLVRANLQYRVAGIEGLMLDAKIESVSKRYARYESVRLPAVTTLDAGMRYDTRVLGRAARIRLQLTNLTNEYSLTPAASGKLTSLDGRRFDLSLALDL